MFASTTSTIVNPIDVIRAILKRLDYGGNDPTNQTTWKKIFSRIIFVLSLAVYILAIISLFSNNYESAKLLIVDFIMFGGLSLMIWSYILNKRRHKDLRTLVKIVESHYWTTDGLSPKQQQKLNILHIYILKLQTFYCLMFLIVAWSYALDIYLQEKQLFVVNMWIPKFLLKCATTSPYYEILFLFQFLVIITNTILALVQYDLLFFSFIAITIMQLKMLKYKLDTLATGKNKNIFEYLAKCIRHHNILLSFLKDIDRIYSMILFLMLCSSMVSQVFSLYELYVEADLSQQIIFIGINVLLVCQFFVYSLLGQVLMDEADSIADAAYNCGWENIPDTNVRRALVLIIQRAQRPPTISVGGLFILKLETFLKVVKYIGTLLTFLRQSTNI